jgi:hypothetical protein
VLPWQDVLHEGPVPAGPRRALLRARASFLSACGWGSARTILAGLEHRDAQLRAAVADGRDVVLWFEHDLYDQLQLLDALALAADDATLSLVVVGSFPGKPGFRGLGELTAAELETLWPSRVPATREVLAGARALWAAVRAPSPEGLAAAASIDHAGLPFVRDALARLLAELPAPRDGLSLTERIALQAVADGAQNPIEAFLAAQDAEEAPFLGDAWFFRTLASLGRGEQRLLETTSGEELPAPPPHGEHEPFVRSPLRLTRAGSRVLARRADRVALLGIDRWVGGTHLRDGSVWRWDARRRRLHRPA